ncbi:methyl-accepting chemotaxis protein [Thermotomaculum hydrothermale]|uniref:methyl-accepting chemotaxis protein n=1 Tax=Thermotomaculum hydrothermale TaxID=981385 RepID=UPI001915B5ED|nr:methyl-accepting chemotaxis protein [Thermotomaculum hydrothermale]
MNKNKNLIQKFFKFILSSETIIFVLSIIFLLSIYDLLNKFWFSIAVFLVYSGYFLVTVYLKNKKVKSALNLIEKKLSKFSEGDFNVLVHSSKEEDEILTKVNEDLIRITNRFESIVANLRGITSNIKENSYRIDDQLVVYIYDAKNHIESIEQTGRLLEEVKDLLVKINQDTKNLSKHTDKTVKFLESFSNQNEDIRITVDSLSMYIHENKEAMEQIQKNTRKVTENTENLSSLSLETFSAITEMESTFKEISKYIDYTQSLTREIIKISKLGMNQSKETLVSVEKVGEVLNTFILKINLLKEQSSKIERIVDAISRIGERTNLLALNATIFSQNSQGDGHDFEIITEKIMELSESSTIALKEISQIIVQFENVILELSQLGKEGSQAMEKALKNMYQTTENFSDISNRLNEIGHHFYNIATASNEHSLGTQQIRDAAHQISDLSEDIANLMSAEDKIVAYVGTKTTFMSEIIDNLTKSLNAQANKVQELLKEFKEVENSTRRIQRQSEELELNNSVASGSINKIKEGFNRNFKNILTMSNTSLSLKKYGEYLGETIDFFRLPYRFQGGTLKVCGITIPYKKLDPAFAETIGETQIIDLIFSGLVRYNHLTNIVPDLCTHWEISDDGLKYTFYLRKDVMFHNGQVFTANDVLATFKRLLDKNVNSPKAGLYFSIKGAKTFYEGQTNYLDGVKVIDDYTVQFVLEKPLVFSLIY